MAKYPPIPACGVCGEIIQGSDHECFHNKEYCVMWEIDIVANNPVEAAKRALEIQRNPESIATVFKVTKPNGKVITIDLEEPHCPKCGTDDLAVHTEGHPTTHNCGDCDHDFDG